MTHTRTHTHTHTQTHIISCDMEWTGFSETMLIPPYGVGAKKKKEKGGHIDKLLMSKGALCGF